MKKRIKQLIAVVMTITTLAVSALPVYAEEVDQYPLKGTFPYTLITRESVDKKIAEGYVFTGDPYADVGTAVPFRNNAEWAQVNSFKSIVATGINYGKILIYLAGLTSAPDSFSGSALTAEEEAVKNEVIKYLNSYDWKNASDYEKAYYTAKYIALRSSYNLEILDRGFKPFEGTAYDCLVKGSTVCDGFAQTYHLLTRAVGLKSIYTSGDGSYDHAWNYVLIDGVWHAMDLVGVAPTQIDRASGYGIREKQIKVYLDTPGNDPSLRWWVEGSGISDIYELDKYFWNTDNLQFDSTIPDQPLY
ncbi:MAG: hypothetical protein LBT06_07470 [Hungatella sp.]|jgi:hypothetical protein|nr:hypothetical protein [Hungatella sp.]